MTSSTLNAHAIRFIPATGNRPPVQALPKLPAPAATAAIRPAPGTRPGSQFSYNGSIGTTGSCRTAFSIDKVHALTAGSDFNAAIAAARDLSDSLASSSTSARTSAVGVLQTRQGAYLIAPAYVFDTATKNTIHPKGLDPLPVGKTVRATDNNKSLIALVSPTTWADLRIGVGVDPSTLAELKASGNSAVNAIKSVQDQFLQVVNLGNEEPSPTWAARYDKALAKVSSSLTDLEEGTTGFLDKAAAVASKNSGLSQRVTAAKSAIDKALVNLAGLDIYRQFGNVSRIPDAKAEQITSGLNSASYGISTLPAEFETLIVAPVDK